ESDHRWPLFLPDGKHFLYLAEGTSDDGNTIYAGSLEGKQKTKVLVASSNVAFTAGHLLYWRDHTLVAQQFDPKTLALGRDIVPIAENVAHTAKNDAMFSISAKGDLVYETGSATTITQVAWFDSTGKQLQTVGKPSTSRCVALSHDGRRLALVVRDPAKGREDIWVEDLLRGTATRLTFDPADEFVPLWSSDDTRIVFGSNAKSAGDIMMKNASGTGSDEVIYASEAFKVATSWSSDQKTLSFSAIARGRSDWDLWLYSLPEHKARVFLQTPFNELGGSFSPDGRWIAYQSDESGKSQIYVLPVTGNGGKWQISTEGGNRALWSRDGKQIFYVSPDWKLMAVDVAAHGDTFEAGVPRVLFQTNMYRYPGRNYDVSADGKRFLVDSTVEQQEIAPITLVQNWTAALRK
ncbi:MAG TPA: hypothetical protein VIM68_10285, partial [Thermoanaerobaculia bacterium]